jgi:hypothetical protein
VNKSDNVLHRGGLIFPLSFCFRTPLGIRKHTAVRQADNTSPDPDPKNSPAKEFSLRFIVWRRSPPQGDRLDCLARLPHEPRPTTYLTYFR